jgi:protein-S-isoprenylcysteine O-methyltransferase Ste14
MTLLRLCAALMLFFQLPIPIFWLILHPQMNFWRRHMRAGYWTAGLTAWGGAGIFIAALHRQLLAPEGAPFWALAAGLVLILVDVYIVRRVSRDLGRARLIGLTEMKGGGELATSGIYSRVRHPRYAGMILSMLGVCLLGWRPLLWAIAAGWLLLALTAILMEERELRARFGETYVEYCSSVPRFLPFRLRPRAD